MQWANIYTEDDYLAIADIISTPLLFQRECCHLHLHPYQHMMWANMQENKLSLNLAARQMGKSTTAMAYMFWYALSHSNSALALCSTKHSNAISLLDIVRKWISDGPEFIKQLVHTNNRGEIRFHNGSRIIARTATSSSFRGMSLSVIYMDEFAFLPPATQTEIIHAVFPVVQACSGKMIVTTTPNTTSDEVYQMWTSPRWSSTRFAAEDHRDTLEHALRARPMMSQIMYEREFECKFMH